VRLHFHEKHTVCTTQRLQRLLRAAQHCPNGADEELVLSSVELTADALGSVLTVVKQHAATGPFPIVALVGASQQIVPYEQQ
jgi:hypothetical protein